MTRTKLQNQPRPAPVSNSDGERHLGGDQNAPAPLELQRRDAVARAPASFSDRCRSEASGEEREHHAAEQPGYQRLPPR